MSDREHAAMLIRMAEKDLKALEGMRENPEAFDDEIFGFHAQQAAEKSLKAIISLHSVKYSKVHDLEELLSDIEENKIELPDKFKSLGSLTDFAVQFRYEILEEYDTPLNRDHYHNSVAELITFVKKQLAG